MPPTIEPFSKLPSCGKLKAVMATESGTRKDSMKVEKLSLLVLTLCIVVLVYLLIQRPF